MGWSVNCAPTRRVGRQSEAFSEGGDDAGRVAYAGLVRRMKVRALQEASANITSRLTSETCSILSRLSVSDVEGLQLANL